MKRKKNIELCRNQLFFFTKTDIISIKRKQVSIAQDVWRLVKTEN